MSNVLEKTFSGFLQSFIGTTHGIIANKSSNAGSSAGLKDVTLGLINFVEKLIAARKISRQVSTLFIFIYNLKGEIIFKKMKLCHICHYYNIFKDNI